MPERNTDPITTLPSAQELRDQPGRKLREAEVLKRMLKVAEFAERQRLPQVGTESLASNQQGGV